MADWWTTRLIRHRIPTAARAIFYLPVTQMPQTSAGMSLVRWHPVLVIAAHLPCGVGDERFRDLSAAQRRPAEFHECLSASSDRALCWAMRNLIQLSMIPGFYGIIWNSFFMVVVAVVTVAGGGIGACVAVEPAVCAERSFSARLYSRSGWCRGFRWRSCGVGFSMPITGSSILFSWTLACWRIRETGWPATSARSLDHPRLSPGG